MKVTYIEHSGFFLETEQADFLFDYYRGAIPQRRADRPLVVFVSHRHQDHYNPEIFELKKEYPNVKYVLSKDVPVKREIKEYAAQGIDLESCITVVQRQGLQEIPMADGSSLRVETLRSTDEGAAFLLDYAGTIIYHAGDLNLWVWAGESAAYNESMRKRYFAELEKLRDRSIDLAFVPLDPRQEQDAFGGLESFLEITKTRQVFPMHFWGNYRVIEEFLEQHPEYEQQVRRITYAGQSFVVKETEKEREDEEYEI